MPELNRNILDGDEKQQQVAGVLQPVLFDLVDLALQGKQAHWNLLGPHFRAVHLQLDEIIDDLRAAVDEVAERIATLDHSPDGRPAEVARGSRLAEYPDGRQTVHHTVTFYSDQILTTINGLREAIDATGDLDPVTQDLLISIAAKVEKHLWMLQAQEEHSE